MDGKPSDPTPEPTEFNVVLEGGAGPNRVVRMGYVRVIPRLDPQAEAQLRTVLLNAQAITSLRVEQADDVTPFIVEAEAGSS